MYNKSIDWLYRLGHQNIWNSNKYHVNFFKGEEEDILEEAVWKALEATDEKGLTSISIPALGAGKELRRLNIIFQTSGLEL